MTDQTTEGAAAPESKPPEVHLADVQQEMEPVLGMSLWARLVLSYSDMRRTTRALIDENPSEPRLLFFVLLSDVIFFLSMGVRTVVSPSSVVEHTLPVPAAIGGGLIGILLFRTTVMYLFAGAICIVARAVGGKGGFRDTRAGVFWASLVASPVGVMGALVGALLANLEGALPFLSQPIIALPPLWIGVIAFVFFVSAGVAEAHRFARTSFVFISFSVFAVALSIGGLFVYARFFG